MTEGGTTFHFVTDGIESVLAQARAVADDRDVVLAGERLLDGLGGDVRRELVRVIDPPGVTHLKYRVAS